MELSDKEINLATDRIYEKLQIVNQSGITFQLDI